VVQEEEKDFLHKTLKKDKLEVLMELMQLLALRNVKVLKNQEKVQEEDLKDSLKENTLRDSKDSQKEEYLKEVLKVQVEDLNGVKNLLSKAQLLKFQLLPKLKVFEMIIHEYLNLKLIKIAQINKLLNKQFDDDFK
jgi:hypothetical protein